MGKDKQLLKNTIILYLRKIVSIVIGLVSARLLLQYLGVDDFGLYGLLGSVVALFSSIRGMFASSVQRFINVERGKPDDSDNKEARINQIFSTGVFVHFCIGIVFLVIVSICGLAMLGFLDIGPNKYTTAIIILECSIFSAVVSILTVPYDALIVSYEHFNSYAVFAIIESFLRLGAVLLLAISSNRVIVYSGLIVLSSIIVYIINRTYCRLRFPAQSKYKRPDDRLLLRQMTQFAGWQFFGNTGYAISNQGINFILNYFGGVALNAARGIAYQLMHTVQQFVSDISISFQPKIMMEYNSNKKETIRLFNFNSKLSFAICFILVFPVCMYTEPILRIWLNKIPEYTVPFVQSILIYILIRSLHGAVDILFKSSGDIRKYQLTEFCIMILNIPVAFILLYKGLPFYWAFLTMCVLEVINLILIIRLAHVMLDFDVHAYFKKIILPVFTITVTGAVAFYLRTFFDITSITLFPLIFRLIIWEILIIILLFFILLSNKERTQVKSYIKQKLHCFS